MKRQSLIIVFLFLAAAFVAGYFAGNRAYRAPVAGVDPATQPSIATPTEASQTEPRTGPAQSRLAAQRPDGDAVFGYERLRMEVIDDAPRACLQFNRSLDATGSTNYSDYITFEPELREVVAVEQQMLCITGFGFDAEYNATLLSGLPAADGSKLESHQRVTLAFGDKPAFIGFAGDGVILPRHEADGLAIETLNVSQFELELYRVSDRAVAFKNIVQGNASLDGRWGQRPWGENEGSDRGVLVTKRTIDVDAPKNETSTTVFPLADVLGEAHARVDNIIQPGAYFIQLTNVSPDAHEYSPAQAWRWVVFTDLALTSFQAADGMHVMVRALHSGAAVANAPVFLVSRGNEVLGQQRADHTGMAFFPAAQLQGEGNMRPARVFAYGAHNDFTTLDLERAPLDLSGYDIAGRTRKSPVDGFLYFDRDLFRPGERLHIGGLLRDEHSNAVTDRGAKLDIFRPDGLLVDKINVRELQAGGFTESWEIPSSANRGRWRVELRADASHNTQQAWFSVEDFVPQQLEVLLSEAPTEPLRAGDTVSIDVLSRFLYGAPGSALVVEGDARLRLAATPFPEFKDYTFGDAEEKFLEQSISLTAATSDAEGNASLQFDTPSAIDSGSRPLRAEIVVAVTEPGGRVVRESVRWPLHTQSRYLGVRRLPGGDFASGAPVKVQSILVDASGEPITQGEVVWTLYREEYDYQWYRQNGEWRWRRDVQSFPIEAGRLQLAPDAALWERRLDWGSYRLQVEDPDTDAYANFRFYQGWANGGVANNAPDRATLRVVNARIKPGDTVDMVLETPYPGEAVILLANESIESTLHLTLDTTRTELTLPTDKDWSGGFYVMASVVTPRDRLKQPIPRRAMAVQYVALDTSDKRIDLEIQSTDIVRPRQTFNLPIKVGNLDRNETFHLTVSAVDEGILRISKFTSPDPVDWYLGKPALATLVHDDYARILDANIAGTVRSGGDQLGGEGLSVVPFDSVALFSGLVSANGNGTIEVPLEIPDFNGELRLMVVAWNQHRVGSVEHALTVRDKAPTRLILPRFLAPGDNAKATLSIDNIEGDAGSYRIELNASDHIEISTQAELNLAPAERTTTAIDVSGSATGESKISLLVTAPDGSRVGHDYDLALRAPWLPVTRSFTQTLGKGDKFSLSRDQIASLEEGTVEARVSFSPLPGISPIALLEDLNRYPYGCSEQLASSAWPLLYSNRLRTLAGQKETHDQKPRVQKAVNRLLDRMHTDGSFGLWRLGDGYTEARIGLFVTQFLLQAKAEGYAVSDLAIESMMRAAALIAQPQHRLALNYQQPNETENSSLPVNHPRRLPTHRIEQIANAHFVLALGGKADLANMRYFSDTWGGYLENPLALTQLAAALALANDSDRAQRWFDKALTLKVIEDPRSYYQSPLRDTAAMIAVALSVDHTEFAERLIDALVKRSKPANRMNTQEKAWLFLASAKMIDSAGELQIEASDGHRLASTAMPSRFLSTDAFENSLQFSNRSAGTVYASLLINGTPTSAPGPASNGLRIEKGFYALDGTSVDPTNLTRGERLIVKLEASADDEQLHPLILVDLLPAAFEIETLLTPEDGAPAGLYRWLGAIDSAQTQQAQDDRYVAAIELGHSEEQSITLAYIVRVVTPGRFELPGATVEDMYRPEFYGRSASSKIQVAAALTAK